MFDIGWSEMAVIAVVALVVIGPKELPNALKTFAYWMKQVRRLAREFQGGIDQIVREAELEDAKKALQNVTGGNLKREIEKTIDPTGEMTRELNADPLAAPPAIAAPETAAPSIASPVEPAPPAPDEGAASTPAAEPAPAAPPAVPAAEAGHGEETTPKVAQKSA